MDKNEYAFNHEIEDVKIVDRSFINEYFQQKDNDICLKSKPKNPIYNYLNSISPSDCSEENIVYASFRVKEDVKEHEKDDNKEKEKKNNYFIIVDTELVKDYNKNLDDLKRNLLIDNYSIPVSFKTTSSTKSNKLPEQIVVNKIKYDYNINLSDSSKNTKIQIESFIPFETKEKIKNEIMQKYPFIINKTILQSFNRDIKDKKNSIVSIIKQINEENEKNPEYNQDDYISQITLDFDNYSINFKEDNSSNLSKDCCLTLFNLLINTDKKSEYIIDRLELCYNIYIFNKILNNKYKEIHPIIKDRVTKNAVISQNKISNFYFIKFIENEEHINKLYFKSKNADDSILSTYNDNINSIQSLENNIDNIINLFGPYCIAFKKIEYILSEYIESLNNKSEKVSDYLDGLCFEDEVKNIIHIENPKIINIPNIYYILEYKEINFCEFDFVCLLQDNEILNLNKTTFDRVVNLHNLKFLENDINIQGLALIFFEIKSKEHSSENIIKRLIIKVNFIYPLMKLYLYQKYNINIDECVLYFCQVFDSKFNPKSFVIPNINKILSSISNIKIKIQNECKVLFIHGDTNIGQINIIKLNDEVNKLNKKINVLTNALNQNPQGTEIEIIKNQLKKEMEDKLLIKEMEDNFRKEMEDKLLIKEKEMEDKFRREMEEQKQKILRLEKMMLTKTQENINK